MREKYQVLVLPYRYIGSEIQYALLKRQDMGVWQGIAGGGEDFDKTPLVSAKREAKEEMNINESSAYIVLDSIASIPSYHFKNHQELWGKETYVIPEYCFGVNVKEDILQLSDEHTEYKWCSYHDANKLLEWDSNRVALWELNERLKNESC